MGVYCTVIRYFGGSAAHSGARIIDSGEGQTNIDFLTKAVGFV
jgi:hypothetical protein